MIYYKTEAEIELMRLSGDLVSRSIAEVAKYIKPGVSTLDGHTQLSFHNVEITG